MILWPREVTRVTDINTDPHCSRTLDPDMTLGSSPGLDDTMTPGSNTVCSDLYGPGRSMTLGQQT